MFHFSGYFLNKFYLLSNSYGVSPDKQIDNSLQG